MYGIFTYIDPLGHGLLGVGSLLRLSSLVQVTFRPRFLAHPTSCPKIILASLAVGVANARGGNRSLKVDATSGCFL